MGKSRKLLCNKTLMVKSVGFESLDVTFNEDRSRIRKDHAPENMAALRRLALNLLRQNRSKSISLRQKRLLCSLNEDYLLQVISS